MDLETIKTILREKKPKPLEINRYFAVLLPLIEREGELHILFEVRSKTIPTQPGEISFPGGGVEVDEDFRQAALRETYEEIGVPSEKIELLGELDYIIRDSNFSVYPYVGLLHTGLDSLAINRDEVEEVFTVPVSYFMENSPDIYKVSYSPNLNIEFPFDKIPNGRNYKWRPFSQPVLFYEYREYIIWGLTARITRSLTEELKEWEYGCGSSR
ncbi:NUDIX hydrolase [Papillibacter cinnamivorans]|uniref:NUDIX domain-containing protein n=1 Tax=Papillibacter cinnamivorans DSM 12816 TaxID=1122930 RepID=A0A1W2BXE8_9FIRM|nr:CoA pyrophosphatase [Papillibacter cinnamivorans]SMC77198.1 NUDIX domain-containing protein [Papillibacter cinnamivorans DSM 12816]